MPRDGTGWSRARPDPVGAPSAVAGCAVVNSKSRPRRSIAAVLLAAVLAVLALHVDCAVAGSAIHDHPVATHSAPSVSQFAHLGSHLPAWDDCCVRDRHLALDTVLPADSAKPWAGAATLWWCVPATIVAAVRRGVIAGRGPPGVLPRPLSGREILTHAGIARR
ncbi:hypothetical protein [Nocardia spumae]|uniref:hypothetical protein n=1 Tax=Nocardia spumae TaxID=2887190 RepID=UPI001D15625B|nr:hypothetical protein [Nocardia spumae]